MHWRACVEVRPSRLSARAAYPQRACRERRSVARRPTQGQYVRLMKRYYELVLEEQGRLGVPVVRRRRCCRPPLWERPRGGAV